MVFFGPSLQVSAITMPELWVFARSMRAHEEAVAHNGQVLEYQEKIFVAQLAFEEKSKRDGKEKTLLKGCDGRVLDDGRKLFRSVVPVVTDSSSPTTSGIERVDCCELVSPSLRSGEPTELLATCVRALLAQA